jgi:ketosteroid isomerase-like protein
MSDAAASERLVRAYFDALGASDLAGLAALLAPDLVFRCASGSGAEAPVVFRGADALLTDLRHNLGRLYDPAVGIRPELLGLVAQGERVAAEVRIRGRSAATGLPYENLYAFFFRIAGGRIAEVHEHLDTAYAKERLLAPAGIATASEMPWLDENA